ncbi:MAG: FAD-dependent oxidoreductase [Atopobiaceae bacterium]|nr:FAD-dependent oxidoreductase [Atopobiaceae bacterium]
MALHIIEEAERCLNCKKPQCQKGCPVGTAIPLVIQLFRERRMDEAGAVLFQNNPMSAVCSLICNHGAQCEGHCVLGRKGSPIHFSAIENYVSSTYLERVRVERPEPCGKRAAVIGGGPAGIVAALRLAQVGVSVTIFDQNPRLGGVMRYGIPEYRLPKRVLDRYQEVLEDLGVRIRHNTAIGASLLIGDLFRDGYDAVFVGTGTWRAQTLGVSGEAGGNVLFGLDYLRSPQTAEVGERVAVIGAGNTAMDVARTAFRQGAREVTMYARSKHISASSDELEYALLDGCELVQGKAICEINEKGPVFRTAIFDENDKVVGYEEELDQVECDTVIVAVSQKPKNKLILTTEGLEGDDRGLLIVDDHGMCTVPGVFAAGDVVTGPNTVVHAVAATKVAVDGMLDYMGVTKKDAS